MQNNYNNKDVVYAGFWTRVAAYLLDSILVFMGLLVVRLFLVGISGLISETPFGGNLVFHYTLKDITLYVFQVLYFILFTYYAGTTPGKRAMNLRVTGVEGELTFLNVLYRETVGRFLCSITIGIGYIMIAIDNEKRGLHDILCDTHVIYAKKVKVYTVHHAHVSSGSSARPVVEQGPYRMTPLDSQEQVPEKDMEES